LVTVTSADSSIVVTTVTTAGNVNIDLSVTGTSATRYTFTANTVTGASNGSSPLFPATPGSGYLMGIVYGQMVTLNGNIRLTSTGTFSTTSGASLAIATAPPALRPVSTVYFYARVFKRATAPYTEPDGSFDAMVSLDAAGVLSIISYPTYPAGSLSLVTAGQSIEIVFGGHSYTILP
jgi:hypothetical protein